MVLEMAGWVRVGFAMPAGSPAEEVLGDGETVERILRRARQRVSGGAEE